MELLRCVERFSSIQGEGVWTGWPAFFVRLAGCNLACDFCDTRESWKRGGEKLEVDEVAQYLAQAPIGIITGGEPLLQRESVVAAAFRARDFGGRVHLETNGTLGLTPHEASAFSWITVSPKIPEHVRGILAHADEVKLLCGDGAWTPDEIVEHHGAGAFSDTRLVVQPLAVPDPEQNQKNVDAAVEVVWRIGALNVSLGVQVHKLMKWR